MFEIHTAADFDKFVAVWCAVLGFLLLCAAAAAVTTAWTRSRPADEGNDPRDFGDGGIP